MTKQRMDEDLLDTPTYQLLMKRFRISKERLVEMMDANDVDPATFQNLMQLTLKRYRSIEMFSDSPAFQREVEQLIEDGCPEE